MNSKLNQAAHHIMSKLPSGVVLPPSRILGMIFLADWRHAITSDGTPITQNQWASNFLMSMTPEMNDLLSKPESDTHEQTELSPSEINALEFIINTTGEMEPLEFSQLIYSTYPMINSHGDSRFNIKDLANKYTSGYMAAAI